MYSLSLIFFVCHFYFRYTTPRKDTAPLPPQRKIIEERMVTREMTTPPVQGAPPTGPREQKQRITHEELTVEEMRKQGGAPVPYSAPPPMNEYRYEEEMLPPPDEYHFEEKRTEMVSVPPDSMDSRKSE